MDRLKVLYPPQPPPAAAEAEDEECARRLHRELNPRPARRGRVRPREEEGARGGAVKEEAEAEEVKIRAVEWVGDVKAEPVEEEEEVKIRALERVGDEDAGPGAAGGGKRRRVNGAEAGTSGLGAGGRRRPGNGGVRGASRFRGVNKNNKVKANPWVASIGVTEDGKYRRIHVATFAQEEDAARAYDRVSIAKLGHAEAKTNFPVEEYRAEWAQLEALGVDGAAALMREQAAAERPDKASSFRGVTKAKGSKTKSWAAYICIAEDGKKRRIHIASFAREEDAASAVDRVNIAKLGHARAKTNFPVEEYREEWAQLEALGVDGAAALLREHAAAERQDTMSSRFRGVSKDKKSKKPWHAYIDITEDGKRRRIHIGTFAREEDAARAYDRVNIAAKGHVEAKTNFPVAEYRAEWAELEALGADGAAALMREHAAAERQDTMNKASRFWGVMKANGGKGPKPWQAKIRVTEDGKRRNIFIGTFNREEDAARAWDRVSIAKLGHAQANTNFPVAEYRAEWTELEALGLEGAAALMREHAAAERQDTMNKASRFWGVAKVKRSKVKPWAAQIHVTEDGKRMPTHIGTFAREEDAARARDRVSIAKLGHTGARTNFPVEEYREEWAQLEALGVDGAVALVRERAAAEQLDVMNKVSRFRGVGKDKRKQGKPWFAKINVTEDGKRRQICISHFAREEDAARAYDRVNIAKLGHAKARTNFPVAEYREEWAQLEALGLEGAVAMVREQAAAERPDKASSFRGVTKVKGSKVKPWAAQTRVTEDGKRRRMYIGTFTQEEHAARAFDRVSIAYRGHAEATTNFPVAEYKEEWAELEALGAEAAAAREKQRANRLEA